MRRFGSMLLCAAMILAASSAFAMAQTGQKPKPVDLTGIWAGYTLLGDSSRADFNLVLAKEGEAYSGKISDDAGMMPVMDIKNVAYKDGTLTFEIDFPNEAGTSRIAIELKLEGETLKGSWVDPNGNSNIIELNRKK